MSSHYVDKCPICGSKLRIDEIDYHFDGNQNEYSVCDNCHVVFKFYIRYHHLWKYNKSQEVYNDYWKIWEDPCDNVETIIVWKS